MKYCVSCIRRYAFYVGRGGYWDEGKVNIDYFMHFAVLRRKSRKKFNCS